MSADGLSLYIVRFEAFPTEETEVDTERLGGEVGGAFVVCYIMAESFFSAIESATAEIEGEGWRVDQPEYAERQSAEDVEALMADPKTAGYIDEAQRFSSCLIFNLYPVEDAETEATDEP